MHFLFWCNMGWCALVHAKNVYLFIWIFCNLRIWSPSRGENIQINIRNAIWWRILVRAVQIKMSLSIYCRVHWIPRSQLHAANLNLRGFELWTLIKIKCENGFYERFHVPRQRALLLWKHIISWCNYMPNTTYGMKKSKLNWVGAMDISHCENERIVRSNYSHFIVIIATLALYSKHTNFSCYTQWRNRATLNVVKCNGKNGSFDKSNRTIFAQKFFFLVFSLFIKVSQKGNSFV